MHLYLIFFFFFSSRRRHTRLQGDWSSDVCSSDLLDGLRHLDQLVEEQRAAVGGFEQPGLVAHRAREGALAVAEHLGLEQRSEERRVGKECRSRWSPYH